MLNLICVINKYSIHTYNNNIIISQVNKMAVPWLHYDISFSFPCLLIASTREDEGRGGIEEDPKYDIN